MSNGYRRKWKRADRVFWVLWAIGVFWGIFGWHFMSENPPLLFGWFPLTLFSLSLNAIAATCLFGIYFYKYWEGRD
jgi:hypothetical protein